MGILRLIYQKNIQIMKLFAAVLALVNANDLDDRLAVIRGHVDRLAAATLDMDNAKDARYMEKLNKWMNAISYANGDGDECAADEPDYVYIYNEGYDVNVFSEDNFCKLNSQINSALSFAARRWACDGRGNIARRAVRRLKKVKNQYNRLHCE